MYRKLPPAPGPLPPARRRFARPPEAGPGEGREGTGRDGHLPAHDAGPGQAHAGCQGAYCCDHMHLVTRHRMCHTPPGDVAVGQDAQCANRHACAKPPVLPAHIPGSTRSPPPVADVGGPEDPQHSIWALRGLHGRVCCEAHLCKVRVCGVVVQAEPAAWRPISARCECVEWLCRLSQLPGTDVWFLHVCTACDRHHFTRCRRPHSGGAEASHSCQAASFLQQPGS